MRAVLRLSAAVAYAAGGHYRALGMGRIWSTADGGQSWSSKAILRPRSMELAATRLNNAYVDVVAAGVFADYRGGVWRAASSCPTRRRAR